MPHAAGIRRALYPLFYKGYSCLPFPMGNGDCRWAAPCTAP